jgi:hypothetical protein
MHSNLGVACTSVIKLMVLFTFIKPLYISTILILSHNNLLSLITNNKCSRNSQVSRYVTKLFIWLPLLGPKQSSYCFIFKLFKYFSPKELTIFIPIQIK